MSAVKGIVSNEMTESRDNIMDAEQKPLSSLPGNTGLKVKNNRKNPAAFSCLSVIVFITLFFTVYWFTDVPPTYW